MKEKRNSSIDWIKEMIDTFLAMSPYSIEIPEWFYDHAKNIEKEQIIHAYEKGIEENVHQMQMKTGKEFYQEIYE